MFPREAADMASGSHPRTARIPQIYWFAGKEQLHREAAVSSNQSGGFVGINVVDPCGRIERATRPSGAT